jgi:EAL domain-containing protein (putative c-di-GMP-specific phosphodiesterase class I)
VLSRWNRPELGIISPAEFISVAEETGTIARMTWHLLNDVFSYMKVREARYGSSLRTSINITPTLLADHAFFKNLFKLMKRYEIPASLLEIEITENVELAYSEKTLQNLLACRSKGVSIALDDFGTGFSKLSYLTRFPIDKIKVDRYFVQKIGEDPAAKGILASLVQFVNSIGCDLVAEGVERAEEAEFLGANGCLVHQGYLYGQPMDPQVFNERYLASNAEKFQ